MGRFTVFAAKFVGFEVVRQGRAPDELGVEYEGLDVAPRRDEASVIATRSDRVLVNSFDATEKNGSGGAGARTDRPKPSARTLTPSRPTRSRALARYDTGEGRQRRSSGEKRLFTSAAPPQELQNHARAPGRYIGGPWASTRRKFGPCGPRSAGPGAGVQLSARRPIDFGQK